MTFKSVRSDAAPCPGDCAAFIVAEGEIGPDSVADFLAVWSSQPRKGLPVLLNSPGGHLEGALALGRAFRRLNVAVIIGQLPAHGARPIGTPVAAPCHSACVYTFAGAVQRTLVAGSTLGVHQFYEARVDDTTRQPKDRYSGADFGRMQRSLAGLAAYLVEMGIDLQLLALASDIPPSGMRALSPQEVASLKLANSTATGGTDTAPSAPQLRPAFAVASDATPQAAADWPLVQRAGRPWLVLTAAGQSRRYGDIANEFAIGCRAAGGGFVATFREILPAGRSAMTGQARIATGAGGGPFEPAPEALGLRGALSQAQAREAVLAGALEVEVVSPATAQYPMRVAFAATGLGEGLVRLERACADR